MQLRPIEVLRAGWGGLLLLAPRVVLARVQRREPDAAAVRVARILGVRHLAQAALSGAEPSRGALALGVWVDAAHAGTAVALAAVDRDRVRPALTDAAVAGLWATAGYRDLHRRPRPR